MADSLAAEAYKKELERKQRDIIRVFNPLERDFNFKLGGDWYKIGPKAYKDWERWIATHYASKIINEIINQMITKATDKLISEREDKGMAQFLSAYDKNWFLMPLVPRQDDKELHKQIGSEVIVGIVEEFGSELPPEDAEKPLEDNTIPLVDRVVNDLAKKWVSDTTPSPEKPLVRPLNTPSETLSVNEVTNEDEQQEPTMPVSVGEKDKKVPSKSK